MSLFDKVEFAGLELSNHIAMAPMTRSRASSDGVVADFTATYYEQRASAGLLITEGATISKQGSGWHHAPGIYTVEQTEAWKAVASAVHAKGGKIACQLWHLGRQCSSLVTGQPIVSASDIPIKGETRGKDGVSVPSEVPHSLTVEEIAEVIADYANAARNAMEAGFDLVEIHGANGYLVDQFSQSISNTRTDEYGGSMENRLRFMNEVLDAVIEAVGDSKRVGIRISPNGVYGDMGGADNNELFSLALENMRERKLGFVHIMDGLGFGFHNKSEPFTLAMARKIVDHDMSIIGNVGYTKETAQDAVDAGDADMISFGRPFLSNPDLVERMENGWPLNPDATHQVYYDHRLGPKGYIDFPVYGEE